MNCKETAALYLRQGKVIITSSDTVFSLTCLPQDTGLKKLCKVKQRPQGGFILTAAKIDFILPFIDTSKISKTKLNILQQYYETPTSFIVPAKHPSLLTGWKDTICIRIVYFSFLRDISLFMQQPLVSTSANRRAESPARTEEMARKYFGNEFPIFSAEVRKKHKHAVSASKIIDIRTMQRIR